MSISTFIRTQWQGIVVGLGLCLFAAGIFVIGSQILTPCKFPAQMTFASPVGPCMEGSMRAGVDFSQTPNTVTNTTNVRVQVVTMGHADAIAVRANTTFTPATCDGQVLNNGSVCYLDAVGEKATATNLTTTDTVVVTEWLNNTIQTYEPRE